MKRIKRISIFTLTLFGFFLLTFQDALSIDCPPFDAQGVNTNGTILGVGSGGMGSNVNIGDDTRASSTRDTSLTSQQGQESDRGSPTDQVQSGQDIGSRFAEREQRRSQDFDRRRAADASRWTGETKQPPVIPTPEDPRGPGGPKVQTPPGGTGTTTPTKTGETPPPKPPVKPEPPKPPVKPEPPPTSTIKPSTVDFPDSSGRFKIMVHFPKGAGKNYKNEKVGDDNVIVIMCPGYSQFVSTEPVELSVLGSGIGKWTVYAIRDLRDPTTRRLLQTLSSMSSDAYYYVVIYDSNRYELSRTYFKVRGTK